jgi:hypothetical protein
MILAGVIRELRLQKELIALYDARPIHRCQPGADRSLMVVFALIRGVDGAKAVADRKFHQRRRTVFFPRRAIQKWRCDHEAAISFHAASS